MSAQTSPEAALADLSAENEATLHQLVQTIDCAEA